MTLPIEFLNDMEKLLGDEFPEFLASYEKPRRNGLRLNRRRISPEEFEKTAPFPAERIPWTDNGYYVDYRDMPARHPYYNAGLYYLQEPSAMAPAQILPVDHGDRILDLCAAPGGKATELGARLCSMSSGQTASLGSEQAASPDSGHAAGPNSEYTDRPEIESGILVANEISATRVRALLHNIEAFGIPNALVTNETPIRLAERFPAYFDKVLVDAPCSGEGMFRKDPDVVKAWHPEKVEECASIQREIILHAADMLRPGGYMVYSTCTFAPEENELILLHLLRKRDQMELIKISCTDGRESFSPAFSLEKLRACGYQTDIQGSSQAEINQENGTDRSSDIDLTKAVRIWPHRCAGEGHFIALLKKREDAAWNAGLKVRPEREIREERHPDRGRDTEHGRKKKNSSKKGGPGRTAAGAMSAAEAECVRTFLERFLPGSDIKTDRLENHEGKLYLTPEETCGIRGLTFLRNGLYIGELKKNRFEPSQELAMALPCRTSGDGEERISFSPEDKCTAQYLRGEAVRLEDGRENGWYPVCVDGYPLGWGKLTGKVLKNKLPIGWRTRDGSLL